MEGSIYRVGRLSDVKYKRISEVEPQPGNLLKIEVVGGRSRVCRDLITKLLNPNPPRKTANKPKCWKLKTF